MRKVLKFGGTSVKNANMFTNVANIISNQNRDCEIIVVLSAAAGVTNKLVEILFHGNLKEENIPAFTRDMSVLHQNIIEEAISDNNVKKDISDLVEAKLAELSKFLNVLASTGKVTSKDRDFVLSFGERLSAAILYGMLKDRKISVELFETDKIGMITDGVYGNATPLLPLIEKNFRDTVIPQIKTGKILVFTGFFGSDAKGNPAIFGRGGGDYSASIVGYAVNADAIEIWTDADGFMSADPRIVKNAKIISEMSYNEAAELAFFGAKVLHHRTVEPARLKNIPILIKNTFDATKEGTRISGTSPREGGSLRSVSSKRGLSIIKIYSPEMIFQPTFVSKILSLLSKNNINTYAISTSLAALSIVVDNASVPEIIDAVSNLKDCTIEKTIVKRDIALICVVGDKVDALGITVKIFQAVADQRANVEMISEGASDVALSFVVSEEDEEIIVKTIHDKFIK